MSEDVDHHEMVRVVLPGPPDHLPGYQRVSYEDMANPRGYGWVMEALESRWGIEYLVRFDDGTWVTSDLRQRGWRGEVA